MLDGLLKNQIMRDADMAGMLTRYNGKPAFFYQKSPMDTDSLWTKPCFPRADYNIDMRYDPEHKVSGVMTVNVFCTMENDAMPENVEHRLIELIHGTFYTVKKRPTVCAVWRGSDAFNYEMPANVGGNTSVEVIGVTITFDLLEFPEQLTTDPDPIQGLNYWTRAYFPGMNVINLDELPEIWNPSAENPAIYWRWEGNATTDRQNYAVNWYTGHFAAHIITGEVTERNRWIKSIIELIQLDGEIILLDRSPMFAKQIAVNPGADPLREGQLILTGQYGVLAQARKEYAQIPLNRAKLNHNNTVLEVTKDGSKIHKKRPRRE